jgi:hypothetical protein
VNTVQKRKEALLDFNKETWLEVKADKTKYMVMSRDQNAGSSVSMNFDIFFEWWEDSNICEQP